MKDWRERFPARYAEERDYWTGSGFEEFETRRGGLGFRGVVTIRRSGGEGLKAHPFEIELLYPPGFPYLPPRVSFVAPRIERARHQGIDGSPCLFPSSAWDDAVPPSEVYGAIERWLGYHLADHFPRELALYELPEYFIPAGYAVLAPPEILDVITGTSSGRFSIGELIGHDVHALRSVDGRGIGKALQEEIAPARLWGKPEPAKWYRLPQEPGPIRHTRELQALLLAAGHQVDLTKRPRVGRHPIGLVFEDATLEQERFFLLDIGVRKTSESPEIGKGWRVRCPEVYIVSRSELFSRLRGIRAFDALGERRVCCFGLGAIGSSLVEALAREGVGSFGLCDPDSLRPGNITRHALDLTRVGQHKAEAVESALCRIAPGLETRPEVENLTDPGVVTTHLDGADLVVAAIGDDPREQLLGEVVNDQLEPPPMICVRTLHAGAAYRVVLIRPGIDACLACLAAYRAEAHEDWIEVPADDLPDVYDAGCATAARPGSGLASQQAAAFAAARAVEVLEGRELLHNHWLWVERPIKAEDSRLSGDLTLHKARFVPRPSCPVCSA